MTLHGWNVIIDASNVISKRFRSSVVIFAKPIF